MDGVDPNFDFSRWRMVPNQALERKIQLGGSIIHSERKDGNVTIVVTQLPIVEHPAYGPKDTGKRSGEFAVTFMGQIEPPFLQRGNRLIVVGTTKAAKVVSVDDIPAQSSIGLGEMSAHLEHGRARYCGFPVVWGRI